MTFNISTKRSGFTLVEILIATGVFGLFSVALMATWTALQTAAMNTTAYAQRQNDQMRIFDYLKRDIRRATNIDVYNGATLITDTTFGNELRLTIPDYYTDTREEDNAVGPKTPATPTLSGSTVAYGTSMTVRYYLLGGAVVRNEAGVSRTLADAAGGFTVSFSKEVTSRIRCRVGFTQRMRSGTSRNLARQTDILCGQRTQLQL